VEWCVGLCSPPCRHMVTRESPALSDKQSTHHHENYCQLDIEDCCPYISCYLKRPGARLPGSVALMMVPVFPGCQSSFSFKPNSLKIIQAVANLETRVYFAVNLWFAASHIDYLAGRQHMRTPVGLLGLVYFFLRYMRQRCEYALTDMLLQEQYDCGGSQHLLRFRWSFASSSES